jgi:hypothetical protein
MKVTYIKIGLWISVLAPIYEVHLYQECFVDVTVSKKNEGHLYQENFVYITFNNNK